jgi:MFS family permease
VRSDLRPARVAVIVLSTLAGALLMAMFVFQQNHAHDFGPDYWGSVFGAIFVASSMILVLWSLLNVSQSVVSERTHRTFDFWRTTRLSPLTLALGKLFGAPLSPWLLYTTAFPLLLLTGLLGHYRLSAIVGSYLVIALFNVALSAIALCGSARAHDSRRANIFMLLAVIGLIATLNMGNTHHFGGALSAWAGLSPATGVADWLQGTVLRVSLFGLSVPALLVTVALSLAVIAWCLVALVRCIKFEPDQISFTPPSSPLGRSSPRRTSPPMILKLRSSPCKAWWPWGSVRQSRACTLR